MLRRPHTACAASPVAHCAPRRWVRRLPGGTDITYRRFLHRAALPTPAAGRASQNTARTASLRPRGLDYGLPALRIWNSGSTRTQQADTAEIAVGPCPTRPSGTGPGRFSPLSWRHGPWCSASDPPPQGVGRTAPKRATEGRGSAVQRAFWYRWMHLDPGGSAGTDLPPYSRDYRHGWRYTAPAQDSESKQAARFALTQTDFALCGRRKLRTRWR